MLTYVIYGRSPVLTGGGEPAETPDPRRDTCLSARTERRGEGGGKKERYLQGKLIARRNVCCTIDTASGSPLLV